MNFQLGQIVRRKSDSVLFEVTGCSLKEAVITVMPYYPGCSQETHDAALVASHRDDWLLSDDFIEVLKSDITLKDYFPHARAED